MSYIMPLTYFLERRCQTKPEWKIKQRVEDEMWYWFPIMMGISTREEMNTATYEQIQILNEVAKQKQELLNLGRDNVDV